MEDVGAAAAWCLRRGRYPIGAALAVLAEAIENSDARMVLTMMDEQAEHPRMARGGDLDPAIPHPYRRPIGGAAQVPAVCWCGEDEHAAVHDLGIN